MIILEVSNWDFINAFKNAGRADNFSIESLNALFDHIDEVHCDEPYMLDVIEICCEYVEYSHDEYLKFYVTDEIMSDIGYEYEHVEEFIEHDIHDNLVNEVWDYFDHTGIITDNYVIIQK